MDSFPKYLSDKLLARQEKSLFRSLKNRSGLIDLCSNDYLGFATDPGLNDQKLSNGSGGSRLLSGNKNIFEETEIFLASFFKAPSALIFNSGYDANLGLLSCISERHCTFIFDEYAHASLRDGLRLGKGKAFHFKHNDMNDLERLLRIGGNRLFVITESVFSMDGDLAPLKAMSALCKKYKASLIVDEAHATGVFGKNGEGCVVEAGIENEVFARIHTFGKAIGAHGAVILGSPELRDYLINFCRPFIYSTALSPNTITGIRKNMERLIKDHSARNELKNIISYYNKLMGENNPGPICILTPGGGNEAMKRYSAILEKGGFDVPAILSPTVPVSKERLRICLHSFNTTRQLDSFAGILNSIKQTTSII